MEAAGLVSGYRWHLTPSAMPRERLHRESVAAYGRQERDALRFDVIRVWHGVDCKRGQFSPNTERCHFSPMSPVAAFTVSPQTESRSIQSLKPQTTDCVGLPTSVQYLRVHLGRAGF